MMRYHVVAHLLVEALVKMVRVEEGLVRREGIVASGRRQMDQV